MASDDLRYPSIASKFKELPKSELQTGRGSMPGKTPEEKRREAIEDDGLISGRGCIP